MAENKVRLTTPRGRARFVVLGREEVINGKPTGKQAASIVLEGEALEEMTRKVEEFIEDTFPKRAAANVNRPFKKDKEGNVYLPAKAYVTTKKGDPINIPVCDRHGEVIKKPPQIGNGSVIRLRVELRPTEFGGKDYVNVRLVGVKLLKLVAYDGAGFDSDEDADYDDEDAYKAGGDEFDAPEGSDSQDNDLDDEVPF